MTRKHCVRCGASLLKREEESAPEPVKAPGPEPVQEVAFQPEEAYVEPTSDTPSDLAKTEEAEAAESYVLDRESGKAVVKDILERVRAAQAGSEAEPKIVEPEAEVEAVEEEPVETIQEQSPVEEPKTEPEIEPPHPKPTSPQPQEAALHEDAPVTPPSAVAQTVDELARDEQIRSLDSEIKTHTIELGQLNSELDKMRPRLDAEVDRYLTVAETDPSRGVGEGTKSCEEGV